MGAACSTAFLCARLCDIPVMVGILRVVTLLNDTYKCSQLHRVKAELLQAAEFLHEVEGHGRQGVALSFFSKAENVKLPACLGILQP